MKYAGIINNDVVNGQGVCVSFWTQGCPHRCPGCHNPETWDYLGGIDENDETVINHVIEMINKNGVQRNLSILGGEPLCNRNLEFTHQLIETVKEAYPDITIFIWTGYTWEELVYACKLSNKVLDYHHCEMLTEILVSTDVIIDGRFEKEHRDITLPLCGSTNQRIIDVQKTLAQTALESNELVLYK